MTECFRRRVIRFFLDRELITEDFVTNMDVGNVCEVRDDESIPSNLLSWKNSGFSIDAKLRLYGSDDKTRESIAQYLVRPPLSLSKIKYEPFKGKVLFKTKYNEYFGENFKVYNGEDFVAALSQHIPSPAFRIRELLGPARVHLVRYYGLYSSRNRGIWNDASYIVRLAPEGLVVRFAYCSPVQPGQGTSRNCTVFHYLIQFFSFLLYFTKKSLDADYNYSTMIKVKRFFFPFPP